MSLREVQQAGLFEVGDRVRSRSGGPGGTVFKEMRVPCPLMNDDDEDVIIQMRQVIVVHLDFPVDLRGKTTYFVQGDASSCFEHE